MQLFCIKRRGVRQDDHEDLKSTDTKLGAGSIMSNRKGSADHASYAENSLSSLSHLRPPGEEVYHTPVIKSSVNLAHHPHRRVPTAQLPSTEALHGPRHTSSQASSVSPEATSEAKKSHHNLEDDPCLLPEGIPKHLNWRQRIKHVTWAYFTLTMATGGILPFPLVLRHSAIIAHG